jgi:ribosomal protein S18 acetylase RimI-like enzyme
MGKSIEKIWKVYLKLKKMTDYLIRKATLNDIGFVVETIIAAEKSGGEKLGLATLFNLTEDETRSIISSMLEEEIDECEFSISSFLITEYKGSPVAAIGGWVEGLIQEIKSAMLKSNLIGFCFPKESIVIAHSRQKIIAGILIERENLSLQIEYVYIDKNHRGKALGEGLIRQHIENALQVYPELEKAQVQVFSNNLAAIKLYEKCGFHTTKTFWADNESINDYLPYNEKLLMEKSIK